MSLKLGTSGVRGTFKELNPVIASQLAQAFATYMQGDNIAIATDTRPSGKYLRPVAHSGLISSGKQVTDFGILPTPILQWLISKQDFDGGISISGGHTAIDWNSMIFLGPNGAYLSPIEVEEFFNLFHSKNFARQPYNSLGSPQGTGDYSAYFQALGSKMESTDNQMSFVVDCSYGATSVVIDQLAKALRVKLIPIFDNYAEGIDRDPEPTLQNASILSTVVRETNCDGGFMLNSDASRILVVDETGRALSEELTLPIFSKIHLQTKKSDIVTTYSTSRTIEQVAEQAGVQVFRTDIGPPSVLQQIEALDAEIGGEGSGSIICKPFSPAYDSFVFMAKVIDHLAKKKMKLSELADEFSQPQIVKHTHYLPTHRIYSFLEMADKLYPQKTKLRDGFYIRYGNDWLCIRASSTMAMIRLVAEGQAAVDQIKRVEELI
jgi:phosphomannomutase